MDEARRLTTAEARTQLRAVLAGETCIHPASVYDPLTARVAGRLGFEAAMLGGSIAALAVLGAPDHTLLTLDEFAGLCRRICRTGALPLIVDADHGFGNALNAMRCVEELDAAGVAAMTLEDTDLPQPYGTTGPTLIPLAAAVGKLEAANEARGTSDLLIAGRTDCRLQDDAALIARTRAFSETGVNAIFLTGARSVAQVRQVREATGLPLMLAAAKGELAGADLAALGVRVCLRGHPTLPAALSAAWRSLAGASGKAAPDASTDLVADLSDEVRYARLIGDYLSLEDPA